MTETALIVGAGWGLSASLARLFKSEGMDVHLAARNPDKLADLCEETGAKAHQCDASDAASVAALFSELAVAPDVVVYNPSARVRGPIAEIDPDAVRNAILISCFGAFLVGQQAAKAMQTRGSGSILFTGASAGVKGYANSAAFAMGKFGLRGLCQSMARELHPKNIHIGHFVIDGGIAPAGEDTMNDSRLSADAIARSYLEFHRQHRSSWAWEIELRPWVETF